VSTAQQNHSASVEPEPLVNEPALVAGKTLVVADLHIGIEDELSLSGINIPSQVEQRVERLLRYRDIAKAKRVVLLGDVKHSISKISKLERQDIPHFLYSIAGQTPVDIVPGNHDAGIEHLIPRDTAFEIKMHRSKGCSISGLGLTHGHAWPATELLSCNYVVMGHNHPIVRLADVLGYVSSKPVWIRTRFEEQVFKEKYPGLRDFHNPRVIIMPAFNELVGGVAFNEASYDSLLGPLFTNRAIKLEQAEAYLLDGTYLGTIKQLRSLAPRRKKLEKTGQNRKKRKFEPPGARDIVQPRD